MRCGLDVAVRNLILPCDAGRMWLWGGWAHPETNHQTLKVEEYAIYHYHQLLTISFLANAIATKQ